MVPPLILLKSEFADTLAPGACDHQRSVGNTGGSDSARTMMRKYDPRCVLDRLVSFYLSRKSLISDAGDRSQYGTVGCPP